MAKPDDKKLRAFSVHGADFTDESGDQAVGNCPFCGKEEHFYVNKESQLWDCKSCQRSGNAKTFLEQVLERDKRRADRGERLADLAEYRGLNPTTLKDWDWCWNGSNYIFPVYTPKGGIHDLRRYHPKKIPHSRATPSIGGTGLLGVQHLNSTTDGPVFLCEGEWDTMVMDEALSNSDEQGAAVGIVGAGTFKPKWGDLFGRRDVVVMMDNDDAGRRGSLKIYKALKTTPGNSLYIHWPDELEDGWDVRDEFKEHTSPEQFLTRMEEISHPQPPGDWEEEAPEVDPHHSAMLRPLDGEGLPAPEVIGKYQNLLHMPDPAPVEMLFSTMFANRLSGDPLWVFLVGPPGCGKSTLIMSLMEAPRTFHLSSMTNKALISGANGPDGGDPSILPSLDQKVLCVKDFTRILNANDGVRDEIFGTLRDAYDGSANKAFGSGAFRDYQSRFGILGGVTNAVEAFGSLHSTLGERFVRFKFPSDDMDRRSRQVLDKVIDNIGGEQSVQDELRETAKQALNRPIDHDNLPALPHKLRESVKDLAQWCARMRAGVTRNNYTGEVSHMPVPEVGTRLAGQFARIMIGRAVFFHRDECNQADWELCRKVGVDTVPTVRATIVKFIHQFDNGEEYVAASEIQRCTNLDNATIKRQLEDMTLLGITESPERLELSGQYALTPKMLNFIQRLGFYGNRKAKRRRAPVRN